MRDPDRGRPRVTTVLYTQDGDDEGKSENKTVEGIQAGMSYLDLERRASQDEDEDDDDAIGDNKVNESTEAVEHGQGKKLSRKERDFASGHMVDVLLSDMCEPWPQTDGFWKRSLSEPYHRMCNTSGIGWRDHAGSMVRWSSSEASGRHTTELADRISVTEE